MVFVEVLLNFLSILLTVKNPALNQQLRWTLDYDEPLLSQKENIKDLKTILRNLGITKNISNPKVLFCQRRLKTARVFFLSPYRHAKDNQHNVDYNMTEKFLKSCSLNNTISKRKNRQFFYTARFLLKDGLLAK